MKFEVVEQPNGWSKEVRKPEGINATKQQRYDYWVAFQDYAFQNQKFAKQFNRRKSSYDHWMNFSVGSSLCHLAVSQLQTRNELDVELYINEDKSLFHTLEENKESIEKESELKFIWKELPDRKASRIIIEEKVDLNNRDKWQEQFDWLIDTLLRMRKAFAKYL